ncbi:DUF421 domain-containing protein [Bacillus licheniformis]|nr:DUF421 domain-containing protein [Bacillus licheniformis]
MAIEISMTTFSIRSSRFSFDADPGYICISVIENQKSAGFSMETDDYHRPRKIDEHAMRTQRYNYDDLMTQLRDKNVERIGDVSYAIWSRPGSFQCLQKTGRTNDRTAVDC